MHNDNLKHNHFWKYAWGKGPKVKYMIKCVFDKGPRAQEYGRNL